MIRFFQASQSYAVVCQKQSQISEQTDRAIGNALGGDKTISSKRPLDKSIAGTLSATFGIMFYHETLRQFNKIADGFTDRFKVFRTALGNRPKKGAQVAGVAG